MNAAEFRRWFQGFLPQLSAGMPKTLLSPATVTDRSDPKLVHLGNGPKSRLAPAVCAVLPVRCLQMTLREKRWSAPHVFMQATPWHTLAVATTPVNIG